MEEEKIEQIPAPNKKAHIQYRCELYRRPNGIISGRSPESASSQFVPSREVVMTSAPTIQWWVPTGF